MAEMIKKKKSKRAKRPAKDKKKEAVYRTLVKLLQDLAEVTVRREKLKQGHGWHVISGACKLSGSTLLFVDSKLGQDEQIEFLLSKIASTEITFTEEVLAPYELPAPIVRQIIGEEAGDAAAEEASLEQEKELANAQLADELANEGASDSSEDSAEPKGEQEVASE